MRCIFCNIDLADAAKICPLCGEKASDALPLMSDIPDAPYPENKSRSADRKNCENIKKLPLRIYMLTLTVFFFATYFGASSPAEFVAPIFTVLCAMFYFINAINERSALLHNALELLLCLGFSSIFCIAAIFRTEMLLPNVASVTVCLVLTATLAVKMPERFKEQLRATLRR